MRRPVLALSLLLLTTWAGGAQAAKGPKPPVVVEVFTSQSCASCAGGDKLLDGIADRPGVLALTWAVDYWNYLGWTDTFARPEFTARQKAYMEKLAIREVYTPQVVVDGKLQSAGADGGKIDALIRQAEKTRRPGPPMRLLRHARVAVGPGPAPAGGAEVWLVRYDPRTQEVPVKGGENRGHTLVERNVVRQLVKLGSWKGRAQSYALPAPPPGAELKTCVLVQAGKGGRILGVLLS